ncbi:MAG: hypothetical protein ACM3VS_05680 [Candidatus Dadabacteria bacterium]
MAVNLIQEFLFQRIKELLPSNDCLADVISDSLYISQDSAYRRIRGETPLVLEEAKILCDKFQISLDQLLHSQPDTIVFKSITVSGENGSFVQFLSGLLDQMKVLARAKDKQIIYLSKELIIFHHFCFKPLFAFQYLFWMKTVLGNNDLKMEYSVDLLTPELMEVCTELMEMYNQIPSIEIINSESINSTIAQIEYYRDAGVFRNDDDVQEVYNSLEEMVRHLRKEAEAGCKFIPGENPSFKKKNYQLYFNRVGLADNTILSLEDGRRVVYLNYEALNLMVTTDENFCNKTEDKLHTIIRQSTLLSDFNEKQRNIFFNTLLRKIPKRQKQNI